MRLEEVSKFKQIKFLNETIYGFPSILSQVDPNNEGFSLEENVIAVYDSLDALQGIFIYSIDSNSAYNIVVANLGSKSYCFDKAFMIWAKKMEATFESIELTIQADSVMIKYLDKNGYRLLLEEEDGRKTYVYEG